MGQKLFYVFSVASLIVGSCWGYGLDYLGVLISFLLPAMHGAQGQGKWLQCQSNLHQLGLALAMYSNENRGWLYPVGPDDDEGHPTTFGTRHPPHLRWPVYVRGFNFRLPVSLPYDPEAFNSHGFNPVAFPAEPFTPPVLRCPADVEPTEAHSYILNKHLADKRVRNSTSHFGGLSSSEAVVAGEKITSQRDYYMEDSDFDKLVELYRHGLRLGSNYLYVDGHVGNVLPLKSRTGIDPWEPRLPDR